jgi:hypothetical protein
VIRRGDVLLDTQQLTEFLGELRSEPQITIADNFRGEAIPSEHMFGVQGGRFFSGYFFHAWDEDGGFRAVVIRYCEYQVVSLQHW